MLTQTLFTYKNSKSRIYKVSLTKNYFGRASKMVVIQPSTDTFESFKEEIFRRFPDLNQKLELFYEDADSDKITIIVSQNFEIFKQLNIDDVSIVITDLDSMTFFVKNDDTKSSSLSQNNGSRPNVDATVKVEKAEAVKTKTKRMSSQSSVEPSPSAKRAKTLNESTGRPRIIMSKQKS
ncbi:uncharacterized protein LOC119078412 [Bradysia coprophila]|uniref:uncharacterized protein LOC119078412 n=1 Tax=Bradysia coprophila TaxID=38358 RepID=UPI00187DD3A1|nr:uncharacterized protein LOC119078412 [Bradysia coprophila]